MVFDSTDTEIKYSGIDMEEAFQMGVQQTIEAILRKRFPMKGKLSDDALKESKEYKDIISVFNEMKWFL